MSEGLGVTSAVSQLGYVVFGVRDVGAWDDFMTAALGLQRNGKSADGSLLYRIDSHHYRIAVRADDADDIGLMGWQCSGAAALADIADRLRSMGVAVVSGDDADLANRMVLGLIRFNAPNGLPTEVYYGPLIEHCPFISPRGVAGFKADTLGLGHIVLNSLNLERDLAFFTQGLGFKISDIIRSTVPPLGRKGVFLHVNPRHHSLALGTPVNPTHQTKRLNHFMLETNRLFDVGSAVDLFTARNELMGPLSCHSNDKMVSCYARTPSGFTVEYGWNGRLIEDEGWRVQMYGAPRVWGQPLPAPVKSAA